MPEKIPLYTIGFVGHNAKEFFELLKKAGVQRVVDIRLRNTNQIAGFTKKDDLAFFLQKILACEYEHIPLFAPTDEILDAHRNGGPWSAYVDKFLPLMKDRKAIDRIDINLFRQKVTCLLCSEHTPEECHRRLIAELMKEKWPEVEIHHLVELSTLL